ncbi:MAG: helix-turn-helix domain-containing protein [Gemmatimonadaceae bacterium]|nr:helix-turn-helix domain-containing protein [Gemmatimonadaceae bacterium]
MSTSRQPSAVVRTSSIGFSAGYRWNRQGSEWGQLVWATGGTIIVRTTDSGGSLPREMRWTVPVRQALWLPPRTPSVVELTGRGVLRSVHVHASRLANAPTVPRVLALEPLLRELLRRVLTQETLATEVPRDMRLLRVLIDELGASVIPELALPMPQDSRARRAALSFIADPTGETALTVHARNAGASLRTLERYFREETSLALGAWRQRAALLHAIEQLAAGASVTQAGLAAGYDSTSAFVNAFRRLTGTTPGKYPRR